MKLHDIAGAEKNVVHCRYGLEGGLEAAEEICQLGIPFTGIVCGEDITAIGVMKGLKKKGFRVPEDVAVTGCNNSPDSLICEPELTTLDNKPELLGDMCAQLLKDVLEGRKALSNVAIQPELLIRGTTQ